MDAEVGLCLDYVADFDIRSYMGSKRQSAGLLLFKVNGANELKVLIAHPGGPIFKNKNAGYWGIPKGEFEVGETPFEAACREFEEETGMKPQADVFIPLGSIVQKGGKMVYAWAFEGDWSTDRVFTCNEIDLEWPVGSGKWHHFPEIDQVRMVKLKIAKKLMRPEQFAFVERLEQSLGNQQKLDLSQGQS